MYREVTEFVNIQGQLNVLLNWTKVKEERRAPPQSSLFSPIHLKVRSGLPQGPHCRTLHLKGFGKRSNVGGKAEHKNVGTLEGCQCQEGDIPNR